VNDDLLVGSQAALLFDDRGMLARLFSFDDRGVVVTVITIMIGADRTNGLTRKKWRDFLVALDATGGPDG
jgi:hypothetical protein